MKFSSRVAPERWMTVGWAAAMPATPTAPPHAASKAVIVVLRVLMSVYSFGFLSGGFEVTGRVNKRPEARAIQWSAAPGGGDWEDRLRTGHARPDRASVRAEHVLRCRVGRRRRDWFPVRLRLPPAPPADGRPARGLHSTICRPSHDGSTRGTSITAADTACW